MFYGTVLAGRWLCDVVPLSAWYGQVYTLRVDDLEFGAGYETTVSSHEVGWLEACTFLFNEIREERDADPV